MLKVRVEQEDEFMELLTFMIREFRGGKLGKERVSKSLGKKMLKEGKVFVVPRDDARSKITKPRYKLKVSDTVFFSLKKSWKKEAKGIVKPQKIPLNLVHESDEFVVVNKPKGMIVHPSKLVRSGTLVNALLFRYGQKLSKLECAEVFRPGIVHRIDKNTSGLLVVARTDAVHKHLKNQFMDHKLIKRVYVALCFNHFSKTSGTITKKIGRHKSVFMKRITEEQEKNKGSSKVFKDAITHYKVLKEYQHKVHGKFSLVECQLETGRTHQIRVHLNSVGNCIVGDTLYGKKEKHQPFRKEYKKIFQEEKISQFLHAKSLGFVHPSSHKIVVFQSSLPKYFESILKLL